MAYRWSVASTLKIFRERPVERFLVTSLSGFFPVLLKLRDGTLVVVARDGDYHVGQRGRLILVVSRDRGESWSPPTVVAGEGPDDRNPALGQAPNGSLIVAYCKTDYYVNGRWARDELPFDQRRQRLFVTRAAEPGGPWSAPEPLPVPPGSYSPYGAILTLPDGTLLMNVYGRRLVGDRLEDSYRAYVVRSRDDGRTWDDWTLIGAGFNETALAALPAGRLLAALRREYPQRRGGADVWLAWSDDGGRSWSDPRRLTGHGEHPASLLVLQSGAVLLTYGHRNPPFGVRARVSRDGGETWDDRRITLVDEATNRDCGYPSSVQLDDGTILTAYYALESAGPFQHVAGQPVGVHAAVVRYTEDDLT